MYIEEKKLKREKTLRIIAYRVPCSLFPLPTSTVKTWQRMERKAFVEPDTDRPLHFKPDPVFSRNLSFGHQAEEWVRVWCGLYGHDAYLADHAALGDRIVRDRAVKRRRLPDLGCYRCSLVIEVRAKKIPMVSMSGTRERPWSAEYIPSDFVAFVSPMGLMLVTIGALIAAEHLAEADVNSYGEPYLVWPAGTVAPATLPECRR